MNFKRLTRTDRQQDRKKKRRKDDEHDSEDIQTTYNELWWTSNIELGGGVPPKSTKFFKQIVYKGGRDTPLADKTRRTVFDRLPIVIISRF